jgi:hypothetical protein
MARRRKEPTDEPEIQIKFVQAGDPSTEDERMVDFLKWLLEKCEEVNARRNSASGSGKE